MNMKEEQTNNKIKKIEKILPLLWNSYEHMFGARRTGIQNNLNFLLIIASFLPAICFMSYFYFKKPLFLIPTVFQFSAILILLKSFFIKGKKGKKGKKGPRIPWLELEKTILQLENKTFEIDLCANLKAAENDTWIYMGTLNKIIRKALILLILSIFLIALLFLSELLNGSFSLYIGAVLLLLLLFLLLHFYYERLPKFNYENDYERYKNIIDKWLKDEKIE